MYIVTIVLYLLGELIINDNRQELMIFKELFEGPVEDYCIACNTVKCLLATTLQYGLWSCIVSIL